LLITTGLVGATSYILILGSAIKKMAKRMKHSPEVVATLFAVLAYAIQAVVNINLPVVFPITWMLLSMGLSRLPETNISSKRSVEDTNVLETGIVNKEEKTLQKDEQKQVIKKDKKPSVEQAAMAKIISVFVIGVLCVHPFLVDDAYFNILQTKYLGFCGMVLILLVLLASYGLYSGILIKGCKSFEIGKIVKGLSIADWGMIIFWFANVMSWVLVRDDSWRYEAFWGTSGRYCGVFLITLYMVVYFCITRLYEFKAWYLDAFLLVGMVICLFGITDYFKMDILNFKVRMIEKQKDKYTATIGNINTYTIYAAAVMAISMILYAVEKCNKKVIFYYVVMVISCAALIMGISDNAYLSLAAMFGLSPLYLFRSKIGTSRYFISIATFFTVILGINWINVTFEDAVIGIKSAFSIIAGMNGLPVVVGVLWVIAISITLGLLKDNSKQMGDEMPKWLSYIWWGVIALVVGAVVFAFYDATVVGNSSRYGAFAPYVTFSEEWGTERGWIWTRAVEMWSQKMSGLEKLFGCGADTFRLQIFKHYPDTYEYKGKVFDSAHNEYLHFLITVGLVGALSYVTWLFASVGKMWKHAKQSPAAAAIMFAILAYMVQATINIFVPVIFPVILVLLSIGLAIARNQEK